MGRDVPDIPSVCVCGDHFNVDHAMICKRDGFVIQRHNELRDLEAEILRHEFFSQRILGLML